MRRCAVIERQFGPFCDRSERVDFHPIPKDAEKAVRLATVVEMPEFVSAGTIEREMPTQFDQIDPRLVFDLFDQL